MGVSLNKGGNVSLTKEAPGLTAVLVGLTVSVVVVTRVLLCSLLPPRVVVSRPKVAYTRDTR